MANAEDPVATAGGLPAKGDDGLDWLDGFDMFDMDDPWDGVDMTNGYSCRLSATALTLLDDSPRPTSARPADVALPDDLFEIDGVDGAYLHVPFCRHKCHYCDFYSFVDHDDRHGAFVRRLGEEIEIVASRWTRPLRTIFVGGGTPTMLAPALWRDMLRAIHRHLPLVPGGEFTVEANPETVTPELAEVLVDGGVTRMSLGAQSFEPRHLAMLERHHDPASVERSVEILRRAGIREINIDLIFGIPGKAPGGIPGKAPGGIPGRAVGGAPGQTLDEWQRDLDRALALGTDHLSAYGLTYEPNTAMTHRMRMGEFEPIDDGVEAAMFEATIDRLAAAGFEHYEISNYARRDALGARYCRHNLGYWRNLDWWAFGPSASGHVRGVRWKNVPRLGDWLDASPWPPVVDVERLDERGTSGERLMLGLRLMEGMAIDDVERLLELGDDAPDRAAAFHRHVGRGLLERRGSRWALTRAGILLANEVVGELV